VQAYTNCSAIALVWNNPSYWTPDNYYIYRSTSSNCDTAPESCSWSLIATPDSGDGTSYDDSNVSEGVNYWYYISMDPTQLNNSTAGCTGTQGTSGDMCALADAPTCPVTPRSVTSTHRCGAIIVGWDKTTDAETYKLQRAVGEPSGEGDYTDITTIDGGDIDDYCTTTGSQCAGECCYTDEDIITINSVSAPDNKTYYYRLGVEDELGAWEWSSYVDDYSYCYRAPRWQEQ